MNKKTLRIAITGPPAAGKSTVLKLLKELGVPTFSADEEVHRLSWPCQPGYHQILKRLGARFLKPNGELDRRALLKAMLKDPKIKNTLEDIYHPLVKERLFSWFEKHQNEEIIAAEIPLLYQAGWDKFFDKVIFVKCSPQILEKRLVKRLQDKELCQKLLASYQVSPRKKDYLIDSSQTIEEIRKKLLDLIKDRIP